MTEDNTPSWVKAYRKAIENWEEIQVAASNVVAKSKVKKKRKPKTYVVMVNDMSGSMSGSEVDAAKMYNAVVKELRAAPKGQTIKCTRIDFGTDIHVMESNVGRKNIALIPEDSDNGFGSLGQTALRDAIGRGIELLKSKPDINWKSTSVVFNVITDGGESASRKWSEAQVLSEVLELQATGRWTFTFLAANQDAKKVGKRYGFHAGNTLTLKQTKEGYRRGTQGITKGLNAYLQAKTRALGEFSVETFYSGTN